ncbi:helix-turn-helix transcriptional regulator [Streptococcus suis]
MTELKNNVKRFRVRKAFTQEQLASKVNCSRQLISSIERGEIVPSVLIALKMAKILEVCVDDIFTF